jgi:hypothetical protein
LGDVGGGFSIPGVTKGVATQGVYFSGALGMINSSTFAGYRIAGSFSVNYGFSAGINVSYGQATGGVNYGIGISQGLGTPGIGAGVNYGETFVK